MYAKRIIPCLDVKDGRVVKGTSFVNLRDAGDPVECAKIYDKEGADELVLLDITASSDARNIIVDIVRAVADSVFIPFTVGGGGSQRLGCLYQRRQDQYRNRCAEMGDRSRKARRW